MNRRGFLSGLLASAVATVARWSPLAIPTIEAAATQPEVVNGGTWEYDGSNGWQGTILWDKALIVCHPSCLG